MLPKLKYVLTAGILAVAIGGVVFMSADSTAKETPAKKEIVVAVVDGANIYKNEVAGIVQAIASQGRKSVNEVYPMVIDRLIDEKLLTSAAMKTDLPKDAEVIKRLNLAKEQIIRNLYLERHVKREVTEATVKSEYKKFKAKFIKEYANKKETHARHILVKTELEAKAIIKELDGGAKFKKLAEKKSIGPSAPRGGDLGYFGKGAMVPEFDKVVFDMKIGEYTKTPVKTQFGWHVIYVEECCTRPAPKYAEVKDGLRTKLGRDSLETLTKSLRKTAKIKRYTLDGKALN